MKFLAVMMLLILLTGCSLTSSEKHAKARDMIPEKATSIVKLGDGYFTFQLSGDCWAIDTAPNGKTWTYPCFRNK